MHDRAPHHSLVLGVEPENCLGGAAAAVLDAVGLVEHNATPPDLRGAGGTGQMLQSPARRALKHGKITVLSIMRIHLNMSSLNVLPSQLEVSPLKTYGT
jgi:hypothetical protein